MPDVSRFHSSPADTHDEEERLLPEPLPLAAIVRVVVMVLPSG